MSNGVFVDTLVIGESWKVGVLGGSLLLALRLIPMLNEFFIVKRRLHHLGGVPWLAFSQQNLTLKQGLEMEISINQLVTLIDLNTHCTIAPYPFPLGFLQLPFTFPSPHHHYCKPLIPTLLFLQTSLVRVKGKGFKRNESGHSKQQLR